MEMVRDGQIVWPYCEECGCRLNISGSKERSWVGKVLLTHYTNLEYNRDARGHKCTKLFDFHEVKRSLLYRGVAQLG